MRVCMLTTGFPRHAGDVFGSFVLELGRALLAQGIEVEVVAPHARGLPRREVLEGVPVQRFRYLVPASWQRVAYGGGIPSNLEESWFVRLQVPLFLAGFWWRAVWCTRRSDVVHCHWTASGLVGYWATRGWPRPLVLSVRGSDVNRMEAGWMGRINRTVYRRMDRVIAVSEDIAGRLRQSGVDRTKVRVVYNGVDERFRPADQARMRSQLGLPGDRFILLFVGLLVLVKGLDVLLEALTLLPDQRLLCVLVGDGPMKAQLQKRVRETGLDERVVFAGQRPTAEIPAWMSAADALALPSRSEGRPNVVLEAQGCGLPVVATRVGGTPELIRDGEDGLLVPSEDPGALARALRRLLVDEDGRRALGRAARMRVESSGLTWRESALQVMATYQELLPGT